MSHDESVEFGVVDYDLHPDAFSVDGVNCFCITYKCRYSKAYEGFQSLNIDIKKCLECLESIDKYNKDGSIDTWAFTVALLITYGKCFSSAKDRHVGLSSKHFPPEYIESHKKLLSLRNKYIAHASGEGEYGTNLAALYPNIERQKIVVVAHPFVAKLYGLAPILRSECKKILLALLDHTDRKKSELYKKIVKLVGSQEIGSIYKEFEKFKTIQNHYPDIRQGAFNVNYKVKSNGMCQLTASFKN